MLADSLTKTTVCGIFHEFDTEAGGVCLKGQTMEPKTNVLERFILFMVRVIIPAVILLVLFSDVFGSENGKRYAFEGAIMTILIGYFVVVFIDWWTNKKGR